MKNVSQAFVDAVHQRSRHFKFKLDFGDFVLENLESVKTEGVSCDSSGLTIGTAAIGTGSFEGRKITQDVSGKTFRAFIGLDIDGAIEWCKLGKYTVADVKTVGNTTAAEFEDDITKLDARYDETALDYPALATDVLSEIASLCGVSFDTSNVPNNLKIDSLAGYTCREAVSFIAQLLGCFVSVIPASEKIGFKWYTDSGYTISSDSNLYMIDEPTCESEFVLEMISCAVEDTILTAGTGTAGLVEIENPLMTQARLDSVYESVKGLTYNAGKIPFVLGNPLLDVWDVVTVTYKDKTFKVPCMQISCTYEGGFKCDVEAYVRSSGTDFEGGLSKQLGKLKTEIKAVSGEVSSKVSRDDLISEINQSPEAIKIKASRIDLQGAVTFSTFDEDTQNTITGASNDAKSALDTVNDLEQRADNGEFKGDKGDQGDTGADGKTTYFHIKYSPVANPAASQMTETPSEYIGTYVDFTATDSTDPSKYTWARFQGIQGEKGEQGIPGVGIDGKTSYLHIAYANSADGSVGFDISDSTGKLYIGQYTDFDSLDSTNYTKYSWTKIKGENGSDGKSVQSVVAEYYVSTSKTTQTGGSWQTTTPTWATGKYLWIRNKITYANPTSTVYTTPYCDSSWEAVNDIEVGGRNLLLNTNQGATGFGMSRYSGTYAFAEEEMLGVLGTTLTINEISSSWSLITYHNKYILFDKLQPNTEYTFSCDIYPSVDISNTMVSIIRSNATIPVTNWCHTGPLVANTWNKVQVVLKTVATLPEITDQLLYWNAFNSLGTFKICNLKLEKGNKATDWSPSPEDVEAGISRAQSTADEANAKVDELKPVVDADSQKIISWCVTNDATKINGGMIGAGTILAGSLVANSITGEEIKAGAITADKLSVTTLESICAKIGGWSIGDTKIYGVSPTVDGKNYTVELSAPQTYDPRYTVLQSVNGSELQFAICAGGMAHFKVLDINGPATLWGGAEIRSSAKIIGSHLYLDQNYYAYSGDMRLIGQSTAGNLIIGHETQTGNIHIYTAVGNNIKFNLGRTTIAYVEDNGLCFKNDTGILLNSKIALRYYSSAIYCGADTEPLRLVGKNVTSNGASVTSDRRLKTDINPLGDKYNALIDNLSAVNYRYTAHRQNVINCGFIAQDVLEALSEAGLTADEFGGFVDVYGDGRELALDYTQFIPILWEQIKILKAKIKTLEEVKK